MSVAEFFKIVRELREAESRLAHALDPTSYSENNAFPGFIGLAVRHHRHYLHQAYVIRPGLLGGEEFCRGSAELETIRRGVASLWDRAELAHPVNPEEIREHSIRYCTRALLIKYLWKNYGNAMSLPVVSALNTLLWDWATEGAKEDLWQVFDSDRGDGVRHALKHCIVRGFKFRMFNEFVNEVRWHQAVSLNSELVACHIGSPNLHPFGAANGPRSLLIRHGIMAEKDVVAWGQYPHVVAEWVISTNQNSGDRGILDESGVGGQVSRIGDVPTGVDESFKWELALTLWNDSFAAGEDAGPYRDQLTALQAAAVL
jgi:hypothetical protein